MPTRLLLILCLLGLAHCLPADQEPKFVSQTFQDIQRRILRRDAETGAILTVNVKEDAPRLSFGLDFSIKEVPHAEEAVVVLSRRMKSGDGVYEQYRLRLDDALRQELHNQKRLKAAGGARQAKSVTEQKKKIIQLSEGKLRYGMTLEEVARVKGQPQKVEPWQAAGAFTAIYPDMSLSFWMMKLTDIELSRKQPLDNP